MEDSEKFDGFYILPGDDDGIKLSYFDFKDDFNENKLEEISKKSKI